MSYTDKDYKEMAGREQFGKFWDDNGAKAFGYLDEYNKSESEYLPFHKKNGLCWEFFQPMTEPQPIEPPKPDQEKLVGKLVEAEPFLGGELLRGILIPRGDVFGEKSIHHGYYSVNGKPVNSFDNQSNETIRPLTESEALALVYKEE